MHKDGFTANQNVLLVDDLLATERYDGCMLSARREQQQGVAGCAFVIELTGLGELS